MGPSVKFVLTIIDAKQYFLSGIARITSPLPAPQFGQLVQLFLTSKRREARITEPSNGDYDNDGSNNCD